MNRLLTLIDGYNAQNGVISNYKTSSYATRQAVTDITIKKVFNSAWLVPQLAFAFDELYGNNFTDSVLTNNTIIFTTQKYYKTLDIKFITGRNSNLLQNVPARVYTYHPNGYYRELGRWNSYPEIEVSMNITGIAFEAGDFIDDKWTYNETDGIPIGTQIYFRVNGAKSSDSSIYTYMKNVAVTSKRIIP
jgi:hypothetical protein